MTKLHGLGEEQLYDRLGSLLETVDTTFIASENWTFDGSLIEIPQIIANLQEHLPGSPDSERKPFWKCVVAVNRAKQGLHLIERLDLMVKRAMAIPPGPFVRTLNLFSRSKQLDRYRDLLVELDTYLYRIVHDFRWQPTGTNLLNRDVPDDLSHLVPVLRRTLSAQFKQVVGTKIPPSGPTALKAWAYLAFVDLAWRNRQWRERYWNDLENFADFVVPFEHDPYTRVLNRLLYGPLRTTRQIVKTDLRARQANASETLRRNKGVNPRPLKQRKRKIP